MSTTTNDPILLNSTLQSFSDQLRIQNDHLSMMVGTKKSAVYDSVSQIAHIVRSNDLAMNKKLFPIGDQIIVPWKDMDDSSHNTDETAYQVVWNFVDHRMVTLKDGSSVPGLLVQMHKCSAYGVQFSHEQAVYHASSAMAAGKYCFTVNSAFGNVPANSILEFTTTKTLPADGRIFVNTSKSVQLYEKGGTSPLETVTASIVTSSSGTDLGTTGSNGLNTINNMRYGHNRYSTSAIRQYLNATGTGWWKSQEDFDIRPNEYAKNGFMTGFNDDFLSAIKPVKITTALNTVEGYSNSSEDTYDTFFLPSLEEMNATPQLSGAEGSYFPYWRSRLGLSGFASYHPSIYDGYKIPAINSNSAQHVRLRSAYRGNSCYAWSVGTSGYISGNAAYHAYRFSPVCVIC